MAGKYKKRKNKDGQLKMLFVIAVAFIIAASLAIMYLLCGNISIFTAELSSEEDEFKTKESGNLTDSVNVGQKFRMYMIDVGQGDAILLEAPGKHFALVDCGTNDSEEALLSFLRSKKIKNLEYVFTTHPHDDHIGGADAVIGVFKTETAVMPNIKSNSSTFERMINAIEQSVCAINIAKSGDTFSLGKASITVLSPDENEHENSNDNSLVIRVEYGSAVFMLMGDAEAKCESMLAEKYESHFLDCDVLKVAHHGSASSSGSDFIGLLSPQIALISCGKNNDEGHPDIGTLETLGQNGAKIYRTDELGTVTVSTDGTNITVSYTKDER